MLFEEATELEKGAHYRHCPVVDLPLQLMANSNRSHRTMQVNSEDSGACDVFRSDDSVGHGAICIQTRSFSKCRPRCEGDYVRHC